MQNLHKGPGILSILKNVIEKYDHSKIFLITGRKSFQISGAKDLVEKILKPHNVCYFNNFEPNPTEKDARRGISLAREHNTSLIISIGGGSVIDMSKLIKAFFDKDLSEESLNESHLKYEKNIPIIAIPTTAGTGSESTHFASLYIGKKKYSIAHQLLLPEETILDGNLCLSSSRYLRACHILDAISQAIESSWAVSATDESQELAFRSLDLSMKNYLDYVNNNSLKSAQAMLEAANLSGQAINISKTTSAHSCSYGFSTEFGIPHGHAVWMTLPKIFELHNSSANLEINDPRGRDHLSSTLENIKEIMGITSKDSVKKYFDEFLDGIGIDANIENIKEITKDERIRLSENINLERMKNNPISFHRKELDLIFGIR